MHKISCSTLHENPALVDFLNQSQIILRKTSCELYVSLKTQLLKCSEILIFFIMHTFIQFIGANQIYSNYIIWNW